MKVGVFSFVFQELLPFEGALDWIAGVGAEAVEIAEQQKPDLVLMDVVMPYMDGYAATHLLHNNPETRDIPVVMASVKDSPEDIKRGLTHGASDYLAKPVSEERLINTLARLLAS